MATEPKLILQHQRLTSLILLSMSKSLTGMMQHLVEILPRRVEAVIAAEGGPTGANGFKIKC